MKYKVWRTVGAFNHAIYVLIVADRPEGPDTNWETRVPKPVRAGHFWTGHNEGRIGRLKLLYRRVLAEQGFMVLTGLAQACALERPPRRRFRVPVGKIGSGRGAWRTVSYGLRER